MSDNKPKNYTSEFKESAVKLATESEQPVAQTAKELGVNPNTLYTWIGKYSQPKEQATVQQNQHLYDELKQLKKELARVTQERDILKKATVYFAKEIA